MPPQSGMSAFVAHFLHFFCFEAAGFSSEQRNLEIELNGKLLLRLREKR